MPRLTALFLVPLLLRGCDCTPLLPLLTRPRKHLCSLNQRNDETAAQVVYTLGSSSEFSDILFPVESADLMQVGDSIEVPALGADAAFSVSCRDCGRRVDKACGDKGGGAGCGVWVREERRVGDAHEA